MNTGVRRTTESDVDPGSSMLRRVAGLVVAITLLVVMVLVVALFFVALFLSAEASVDWADVVCGVADGVPNNGGNHGHAHRSGGVPEDLFD
tara:strand:- start:587 stop:859 length:273 start_codon:yes stop_codon:yes gene_type:complete